AVRPPHLHGAARTARRAHDARSRATVLGMTLAPIWHDVECGYYAADLELWEELSHEGATVLDLGCGNGRVATHLARRGRRVTGLDRDPQFLEVLQYRATQRGLAVDTVC